MLVATNYQVLGNQPEEVQRFRDNSSNLIALNKHQTKEGAKEERRGRRRRVNDMGGGDGVDDMGEGEG